MSKRTTAAEWFLDMALRCAYQGSCRRRNYGSILVDVDKHIISTGYTGSPAGTEHCSQKSTCWREVNKIPSGTDYSKCFSVHSEANALLQAGKEAKGSVIYIAGYAVTTGEEVAGIPCFMCAKMLVNAGVKEICMRSKVPLDTWLFELVTRSIDSKYREYNTVYIETRALYEYLAKSILK